MVFRILAGASSAVQLGELEQYEEDAQYSTSQQEDLNPECLHQVSYTLAPMLLQPLHYFSPYVTLAPMLLPPQNSDKCIKLETNLNRKALHMQMRSNMRQCPSGVNS